MSSSVYSISRSDPMLAMRIVDMMPMGQSRDRVLTSVAEAVASQDVDVALDWVRRQPEDRAQMTALSKIMSDWAEAEPVAAAAYVLELSDGSAQVQARLVQNVAGSWVKQDPAAALEWTSALKDDAQRADAMKSLVLSWSHQDFEAAQAYILDPSNGIDGSEHINDLVRAAVSTDPQRALEFIAMLPESEQTDGSTQSLVAAWTRTDPLGASEWVNDLPLGHKRDVAACELVGQIYRQSPKDALPLALQIENETLRNQALGNVASGASQLDSEIVRQSIEAMTVGEKRKAWLRKNYLKE